MASGEGERQPAGGAPSVVHFTGTANILQARERLEAETGMEAMAAFHRWRTSSLKTHYGRQLRDILTDVRKDEGRLKHAQVRCLGKHPTPRLCPHEQSRAHSGVLAHTPPSLSLLPGLCRAH